MSRFGIQHNHDTMTSLIMRKLKIEKLVTKKLIKMGKIGLVFDKKLEEVGKNRLQITHSLNPEIYDSYADSQVLELEISK